MFTCIIILNLLKKDQHSKKPGKKIHTQELNTQHELVFSEV